MLTRIVRMEFSSEGEKEFLVLFHEIQEIIRAFPGCLNLTLQRDINRPGVLYTLSIWEDEAALERYRNSSFFREVWPKTKRLFASKAMAASLMELE